MRPVETDDVRLRSAYAQVSLSVTGKEISTVITFTTPRSEGKLAEQFFTDVNQRPTKKTMTDEDIS
jgi:hypothetical protein